jgi:thiol-disulfide isomerase/thioredoxin
MRILKFLFFLLAPVLFAFSQIKSPDESNLNGAELGSEIKDFLLRGVNGKNYSLSSFPSAKGFIIVFTSNYCPFSKSYEERLISLEKKYNPKSFALIAISSNISNFYKEDRPENIFLRVKEKGITFPILIDDKQEVAKRFGANRTPQVFLLKKENDKFILKYSGAIDDNPQDPSGVSKKYLEDALDSILNNKPINIQKTKPIGCAIRLN